ncbi:hypothetical protein CEXT_50011 [Caerostris extrusa]|uniref:Uncharacterized protein n=1 Tax=Caerostris extrusa TaxID=172846 RepID=A0AAV4RPJ5_CAEEX|nr:hypothetical protein CEXT_50011 [Caerostris extrusa]
MHFMYRTTKENEVAVQRTKLIGNCASVCRYRRIPAVEEGYPRIVQQNARWVFQSFTCSLPRLLPIANPVRLSRRAQ